MWFSTYGKTTRASPSFPSKVAFASSSSISSEYSATIRSRSVSTASVGRASDSPRPSLATYDSMKFIGMSGYSAQILSEW